MKQTKKSLLSSVLVLVLVLSMFMGTTLAWFTDSVSSNGNVIQSGNLNIDLVKGTYDGTDWSWASTDGQAIFNYDKWEPGYTTTAVLAVENLGTLNARWTAKIRLNGTPSILADVVDVYVTELDNYSTDRPDFNDGKWEKLGSVREVLDNDGLVLPGDVILPGELQPVIIALHMREDAGNEYQNIDLGANFDFIVIATQATGESDSFGDDYDDNAVADIFPGFQGGSASVGVTSDEQGMTTTQVSMSGGDASAVIPAGVLLADGVTSLKLDVTTKSASEANIQLGDSEVMSPLDVHIEGVAAGNTTPMFITLESYLTTGLNTGALKLYHVENGNTVVMTQVANPTNHNEFSYDPSTGDVTLAMASFSEVAVVADENNPWDGTVATAFASGDGTENNPYLIANADQLAHFRDLVDGGNSFEGKFVKLENNIYLSNQLFDPIGWGYVNTKWNRNNVEGKVFKGTFDGNGKTIFDLYQNGWDLEVNGADYTYTNCGFGLFAAASGATFKNLNISGAYVRVECVEAGVLVGLSQNNCTYSNIKILNSKIANYQRPAGGLIGEVSGEGTTTITGVTIGDDVVVGSLWGDFDAPCGGVIGAYWNDVDANPEIVMTNVDVGCTLDVYNDITSAYQWHAYRRAGMLIGNTDMSDPNNAHKAYAPFLKCEDVRVYYGDWVNYTYCSFSNHNERYPWVRTQAGENCTAFSNPRWGVPNDANDNRVVDMNHVHKEGDECNILRQFGQLYGGGQGVYGQDKHDGVTYPNSYYSITYVNDGKTLDIIYVTDNSKAEDVANDQAQKLVLEWAEDNIQGGTIAFGGWMNAGSYKLTEIPAGNTKNVVLYPYFDSPYTASFVDQNGNILAWCLFNNSDVTRLPNTFATAKENMPDTEDGFTLVNWVIRGTNLNDGTIKVELANDNTNWESFKGYKDVTITPHYRYNGADLIEVFDEITGEIDHYQVAGYADGIGSTIVEIPDYVNGKPVTTVNADAFSSYDDLHSVRIPGTVTIINSQSFTADNGSGRDTVTIYYEGDPAVWTAAMEYYNTGKRDGMLKQDWDNYMGDGSRVFFLDENGKVIESAGYWELYKDGTIRPTYTWIFHNHAYNYDAAKNCSHGEKKHYEYGGGFIGIGSSLQKDKFTNYAGTCDCDSCDGKTRPDADYWN